MTSERHERKVMKDSRLTLLPELTIGEEHRCGKWSNETSRRVILPSFIKNSNIETQTATLNRKRLSQSTSTAVQTRLGSGDLWVRQGTRKDIKTVVGPLYRLTESTQVGPPRLVGWMGICPSVWVRNRRLDESSGVN